MTDLSLRTSRPDREAGLCVPRYVPYAPVRRQLSNVCREVNRVRVAAGLEPVAQDCLPLRRRIVRPFAEYPMSLVLPSSSTATPSARASEFDDLTGPAFESDV